MGSKLQRFVVSRMVRFSPSSSVQPFDGSQQGQMVIAGRQTVIESGYGVSPLANTTLVQFTPYLGGGIYNDLISFSKSSSSSSGSTPAPSTTPVSAETKVVDEVTPIKALEVAQTAPLTAANDAVVTATTESTVMGGETSLATAAVVSDGDSAGSSDSGSITSTASVGSTSSAPPQAQALTSSEASLVAKRQWPLPKQLLRLWGLKTPSAMLSPYQLMTSKHSCRQRLRMSVNSNHSQ